MSSLFNAKNRDTLISEASSENYDLIIIGGGITGAGILLDAASRGLKTILVEKSDFAAGTSSRSTKLIHGGLRYLKNLEFRLVHNIGKERSIAYKNAPHLVIPEKLLLPITKNGSYKKWQIRWALKLYDLLAGVKGSDKRQILNKKNTLLKEPILYTKGLLGAGYYAEYRTDDARLTLEIIKTAFQYNGRALNYCQAIDVGKNKNKITSITCKDILNGTSFKINSKKVVNACGPWVDDFIKLDHSNTKKNISLSKGIHIVVNKEKLPLSHPVYFDVNDGRMCFAIPRNNSTYIGTTDSEYFGNKEEPEITKKDVSYLLDAINKTFQVDTIYEKDIISSWSGLRPLVFEKGKKNAELSRKDEIIISKSGLITIAGGKLTGYRKMAHKVVDIVCKQLDINKKCLTSKIKISGSDFSSKSSIHNYELKINSRLIELGIDNSKTNYLIRNYGSQTNEILQLFIKNNFNFLIEAEVVFCLNNECLYNPLDFFLRRTGKIYFNPEIVLDELEIVMPHFTSYLNLEQPMVNKMKDDVKKYLENVTTFKS